MANTKKRPSKSAKAAKKILEASQLLATKAERELQGGDEFKASVPSPRTSPANKPRPDKKRG